MTHMQRKPTRRETRHQEREERRMLRRLYSATIPERHIVPRIAKVRGYTVRKDRSE